MKKLDWLDVEIGDHDELVDVATYQDEYVAAALATIRTPSGSWLIAERMAGRGQDRSGINPATERGIESLREKLTMDGSRWVLCKGDETGATALSTLAAAAKAAGVTKEPSAD
jgi:hypothetical protein